VIFNFESCQQICDMNNDSIAYCPTDINHVRQNYNMCSCGMKLKVNCAQCGKSMILRSLQQHHCTGEKRKAVYKLEDFTVKHARIDIDQQSDVQNLRNTITSLNHMLQQQEETVQKITDDLNQLQHTKMQNEKAFTDALCQAQHNYVEREKQLSAIIQESAKITQEHLTLILEQQQQLHSMKLQEDMLRKQIPSVKRRYGRNKDTMKQIIAKYCKKKKFTRTMRNRILTYTVSLIYDGQLAQVLVLFSKLRQGRVKYLQFMTSLASQLDSKTYTRTRDLFRDSMLTVSEALQQKDATVSSDECYNDTRLNLALHSLPSLDRIKKQRGIWNKRLGKVFKITKGTTGYYASVKQIVKFIVRQTLVAGYDVSDDLFLFKISVDGRPLMKGQVGIMIVPLNSPVYPTQDPNSVVYISLFPGKEN
jgi:uncharacterized phage infection (PIP) family protein YhgE